MTLWDQGQRAPRVSFSLQKAFQNKAHAFLRTISRTQTLPKRIKRVFIKAQELKQRKIRFKPIFMASNIPGTCTLQDWSKAERTSFFPRRSKRSSNAVFGNPCLRLLHIAVVMQRIPLSNLQKNRTIHELNFKLTLILPSN